MPRFDSPHWGPGCCLKHGVPQDDCPACLADPIANEVTVRFTETEMDLIAMEQVAWDRTPRELRLGPRPTLSDLLPVGWPTGDAQ